MAGYIGLERTVGTSAANTVQTVSGGGGAAGAADGAKRRVLYVLVAYSAAPSQTGVTITINSGAGAGYDTLLLTGTANARYNFWQPDEPLILMGDDSIDVLAPAAGGVITSSIAIVTEGYYGAAQ